MKGSWRELQLAAQDACQADCRRHRERARLRLARALDALRGQRPAAPDARDALLGDLIAYAAEFGEDPLAAQLVARARAMGLIPAPPETESGNT